MKPTEISVCFRPEHNQGNEGKHLPGWTNLSSLMSPECSMDLPLSLDVNHVTIPDSLVQFVF